VGPISATVYSGTTITFTIDPDCNYIVQINYDLTVGGNTFPFVLPEITPPTLAGGLGTLNIRLVSPSNPADYTFLWNTGATTQSITGVAGNYSCRVSYTPATFTTNVLTFNFIIPISETGA
jgi:hypothetical protein